MPALIRAAFPNIIIPGLYGIQRPRWPFAINRDSLQAENLVAWWPYIFGTSPNLREMVKGYDGNFTNGLAVSDWVRDDLMGNVISFPGTGSEEYVNVPRNAEWVVGTSDFYVFSWFKSGSATTQVMMNHGFSSGVENDQYWRLRLNSAGTVTFNVEDANAADDARATSAGTYADDEWHLAVGTRTGNSVTLYVDGVEDGTGSGTATTDASSSQDMKLGVAAFQVVDPVTTPFIGEICHQGVVHQLANAAVVRQKWEPPTRWNLYYEWGRVFYSFGHDCGVIDCRGNRRRIKIFDNLPAG